MPALTIKLIFSSLVYELHINSIFKKLKFISNAIFTKELKKTIF